jgi:hypothetical protein
VIRVPITMCHGLLKRRALKNGSYIMFNHPNETVFFSPEGRVIASSSSWENILIREIDLSHTGSRATRTMTIPNGFSSPCCFGFTRSSPS